MRKTLVEPVFKICWGLLFLVLAVATAGAALAAPVQLTAPPDHPLGVSTDLLVEDGPPLSIEEVQIRRREGQFQAAATPVPSFGIGPRPVWAHLDLLNPTDRPLSLNLTLGTTWIDHLDVYIVQGGQVIAKWKTGDALPGAYAATPGEGFTFAAQFPPGQSELYARAETQDPLVFPIALQTLKNAAERARQLNYGYGFLYGFLIALIAYNAMFYTGLRKRGHLNYALYLASFIAMNLAYTGHGYAWWWPQQPLFQRYVILAAMVFYGCCGLMFANRFLTLAEHAPRALRAVQMYMAAGVALLGLCIALDSQRHAAQVAFVFVTLFTLGMVLLGIITVLHKRTDGTYFLAAAFFGMLGSAATSLSVWGWIPYNNVTYHGIEIGIVTEATLLALALAHQVRHEQLARLQAEYLAHHDPLTGMQNRRAFIEHAQKLWSTAERKDRPLSAIMLDIDHFKQINDQYGHETGDRVLIEIAQLLGRECRAGDIAARWGGEEFVLLLPETGLEQSHAFAERMRQLVNTLDLNLKQGPLTVAASLGVAERVRHSDLAALIAEADKNLYAAKAAGRNRVASAQKIS